MKKIIILLLLLFGSPMMFADTVIQMEEYGGVYRVPCLVNGAKMKFIFDTGASSVCLSMYMAEYLYDNGYITKDDIIGTGTSSVADGRIVDHLLINIKEIKIGDKKILNVEASVIDGQEAPLLLGQSALKKLGKYSISGNKLIFKSSSSYSEKEYTDEELEKLLDEAIESYNNESFYVAKEKYRILFENNCLSAAGILSYADCCFFTDDENTASELYLSIVDEIEKDLPDYKLDLYFNLARCLFILEEYDDAIPYCEKAKLIVKPWGYRESYIVYMLSRIFSEKGNHRKAVQIMDDYITKYLSYKNYKTTDCWDKNYKDEFLAELFMKQGINYGNNNDIKTFVEFMKISAAWGSKEAIQGCKERGIIFSTKSSFFK